VSAIVVGHLCWWLREVAASHNSQLILCAGADIVLFKWSALLLEQAVTYTQALPPIMSHILHHAAHFSCRYVNAVKVAADAAARQQLEQVVEVLVNDRCVEWGDEVSK